jgi:hypothetical protein
MNEHDNYIMPLEFHLFHCIGTNITNVNVCTNNIRTDGFFHNFNGLNFKYIHQKSKKSSHSENFKKLNLFQFFLIEVVMLETSFFVYFEKGLLSAFFSKIQLNTTIQFSLRRCSVRNSYSKWINRSK